MRFLYYILICLISFYSTAQSFNNQWVGHYSYSHINDISATNTDIYVASENSIYKYDIATQDLETFSSINGLSGQSISAIHRSEEFSATIIGYENGLIEVIQDDVENVTTLIDIREKPTIDPDRKRINHFVEKEGRVLVATGFGIVELRLDNVEFGDTFFIGAGGTQINVLQSIFFENNIYAVTPGNGILRAEENNPNLVDFSQWTTIATGDFRTIQVFNNNLYVQQNTNLIRRLVGNTLSTVLTLPSTIESNRSSDVYFTVTLSDRVLVYNTNFQEISTITNTSVDDFGPTIATVVDDQIYIGTNRNGMLETTAVNGTTFVSRTPLGPLANSPFGITFSDNNLWVSYGEHDVLFNPFPLKREGISKLTIGESWTNILRENVLGATSLVHIAVNPFDTEQVFVSSFQDGLLELNENVATNLYNSVNSGFETFTPGTENTRLNGAAFNSDGNLWIVNSRINNGLKLFNPETKEIENININGVIANPIADPGFSKLVLDRRGNVFFGSGSNGVIGYNPSDGIVRKINAGNDSSFALEDVRSLAVDQNNQLWIGTRGGLRVFFNTANVFEQINPSSSNIVILDNGVPQELLFEQFISDIEVDGSNNKWVATGSSGVFYLSPDGQETLAHYTIENSPLPSNTVQDIAIDGNTGSVYFATVNGLIEFKGTATDPEENLENVIAFPNPVKPNYSGVVTIKGLTTRANVKITDIEGNLVYEQIAEGGSIQWDTTAFGKHRVASGVYLILVTGDEQEETTVSKLMIIR